MKIQEYQISINFSKIRLNFFMYFTNNILAYKSLAPPKKKFHKTPPKSRLFHTATLNFILFMTLKKRKG